MSLLAITYNGLSLSDGSAYILQKLGGIDGVEIRISEANKTGFDGGNIFKQLLGMRQIWFEGLITGTDASDFATQRRNLVKAFNINTQNELVMQMWDGSTVKFIAKVITAPMLQYEQENINFVPFRIELKCESPYVLSTSVQNYQTGLAVGGGFTIPAVVPIAWTQSSLDTFVIANGGDVEAYASFRIYGPCLNPTVLNQTTGKSFQIAATLLYGQYVDVYRDTQGLWVIRENGVSWFQYFSGEFFKIKTGNNTIKFTASTVDPNALLTAQFTNNYLSV